MKVAFFVTTYNLPNLRISLPAIERYIRQNKRYQYYLLISNDNPKFALTEEFVYDLINPKSIQRLLILNTDKNLGCLGNRLKCINQARQLGDIGYFMFIDDDDVILNPSFESDKFTISHRAVVTHRILEVLTLIGEPSVDLNNPHIEYEEWKMGCVGVPYWYDEYYKFIQVLTPWLPKLYELYGSERVMEPDDVILMNLWNVYLSNTYNIQSLDELSEKLFDKKDRFSYSLTFLEDRKGRYDVEKGICDLRYGDWDGKTTYMSIIEPMISEFDRYMKFKQL